MEQYIKKSALVTELERRKKKNLLNEGAYEEDIDIIGLVNTLEVKESDLKEEIENYLSTYWLKEKELYPFLGHMAKYFFELGLKAQKGE